LKDITVRASNAGSFITAIPSGYNFAVRENFTSRENDKATVEDYFAVKDNKPKGYLLNSNWDNEGKCIQVFYQADPFTSADYKKAIRNLWVCTEENANKLVKNEKYITNVSHLYYPLKNRAIG
jgi:hypothetical protein